MKNITRKKKWQKKLVPYPSEKTRWAYWMQAIEPKSEEINQAFPGYHPQWIQLSQRVAISPENFKMMRESLGLTVSQCGAYMRIDKSTIHKWEKGVMPVPFIAFELLRIVRDSVWFKMKHPDWDGWFISEKGTLVSPNYGRCEFTPDRLEWISWQGTEAAKLQREVNRLKAELSRAQDENTALRKMFLDNGVTDEVASMQEKIHSLMERINTARVFKFTLVEDDQHLEKVA